MAIRKQFKARLIEKPLSPMMKPQAIATTAAAMSTKWPTAKFTQHHLQYMMCLVQRSMKSPVP